MIKKWKQFLWIVVAALLLTACGLQSVEQYEKMQDEERSIEEPVSKPTEPEPPEVKDKPIAEVKEEVIEEKPAPKEEEPQKEEPKQEVKEEPKAEPKQPEIKQEPIKQEEPVKQETPQPIKQPEPPKEEPKPAPAPKKRTVTIAIYVHSLVANMDKLHPSLRDEKYVPASGVILKPVTYELLSEKDTVWDVLKRAAKEHQIQLEYEGADENLYDSVYIEGIHHLYEFSAGPLSGWMYKVNGTFPSYGASQYTLEDGDLIEWHYTIDLGRDLGKDV